MNRLVEDLRAELIKMSDEKTRKNSLRFFKETVLIYGVRSSVVKELNKKHFKNIRSLNKRDAFKICEEMFASGYSELAWIAADWVYKFNKEFKPKDIDLFEGWIDKYINDWAKCDTFCNHNMGALIEMYPRLISRLKIWANSKNRWMRRASAVSLIIPAKKGLFIQDVFEIANSLLLDKDDMVQKGYGWMLKVASQASPENQKRVFDFVIEHKKIMPRTALRYAIEKMPKELKEIAMKK